MGLTHGLLQGITRVCRVARVLVGPRAEILSGSRLPSSSGDRRYMLRDQIHDTPNPSKDQAPHSITASPRPPPWKVLLIGAAIMMLLTEVTVAGVFTHIYSHFARIIDARLGGNVLGNPAVILAAPRVVHCGQTANARDTALHLERAGYTEGQNVRGVGSFALTGNGLEVRPGPESFFRNGQIVDPSGETGIPRRSPRLDHFTRQYDRLEDLLA